ncbi:hypothetical protein IMG5_168560 [Ichthyophthirius multifiliis]|uniref:3'-5' exonuclease domain-containing protein n=1 Tax=Ichthyophthirius multifiliis TaxID=5932 RepID=G0R153_ICHMU|nr:hypothetical protein IMG5_168560 [Ichthyophthirius multifiliis]EGR28820.1 hypothetical protein IMG5_168560 [Ichthyophthirius multifiliis]|eukprot:XP_004030056.1 hypothetical protein IMG5_168560 [Ichthyophthirius multifiliis]
MRMLKRQSHAWDTETIDIDLKTETLLGKGKIICAFVFCGQDLDFGLFIDNFGQNKGLINIFQDYLEDYNQKKIWHNYGFDRHILYNHNINVQGFGGVTMHMARLLAQYPLEYSLSVITKNLQVQIQQNKKEYLIQNMKNLQAKIEETQNILEINQNDEAFKDLEFYKICLKKLEKNQKYFTEQNHKDDIKKLFGQKKKLKN